MTRKPKTEPLASPTSRAALKSRKPPYWVRLAAGAQIGYRTGHGKAGRWLVRLTVPGVKSGRVQSSLGFADDLLSADGIEVLTYDQARDRAQKWVKGVSVAKEESRVLKPAKTVSQAVSDYVAYLELEKKSASQTDLTFHCYVLKHSIAKLPLSAISIKIIEDWRDGIAKTPRLGRNGKAPKKPKVYATEEERNEALRKRKSTANRVLNSLKAALNHAVRRGADGGPNEWRLARGFRGVDGIRTRFLSIEEQELIVASCGEPALCKLVQGALYTGLRVGSLSKLRVRDIHLLSKTLLLSTSKGGSNMVIPLSPEARGFLASITAGMRPSDFVFTRADGTPWGKNHYVRPIKEAIKKAGIEGFVFHELRHSFASTLLMAGVNQIALAKAMGHKSTRMIEKHYGHLLPDWAGEEIEAKAPHLGLEAAAKKAEANPSAKTTVELDPRIRKRLGAQNLSPTILATEERDQGVGVFDREGEATTSSLAVSPDGILALDPKKNDGARNQGIDPTRLAVVPWFNDLSAPLRTP